MGSGIGKRAMENSLTALQRIQRLEGLVNLLNEDRMKELEAFNGAFARQAEKSSTIEGVVNAIVDVLDKTTSNLVESGALSVNPGIVLDVLKSHIKIRREAQVQRDKETIAKLVETGSLKVADTIAEDSLIVGEELDSKNGGPGWTLMEFSNVLVDFQPLLIGKHVGDDVQLGERVLSVKEIYTIVPPADAPPADTTQVEAAAEEASADPKAMAGGYVAQEFAEAPEQTARFVRGTDEAGNPTNIQVPDPESPTDTYVDPAATAAANDNAGEAA